MMTPKTRMLPTTFVNLAEYDRLATIARQGRKSLSNLIRDTLSEIEEDDGAIRVLLDVSDETWNVFLQKAGEDEGALELMRETLEIGAEALKQGFP